MVKRTGSGRRLHQRGRDVREHCRLPLRLRSAARGLPVFKSSKIQLILRSIWVYFWPFLHVCPELVWANSTLACPELVLAKRRVSFEKTRWIVTRPRTQTAAAHVRQRLRVTAAGRTTAEPARDIVSVSMSEYWLASVLSVSWKNKSSPKTGIN